MSYRLVIFDFDGTLADSSGWFIGVLDDLAKRHRFRTVDAEELEEMRGLGNREIVRRFGIAKWKLPFIAADLRKRAATADIALFDGVAPLLAALRAKGIVCALVRSNSEANVRRVLGDQAAAFAIFDCGSGLFGKARRFARVMKRAGVSPAETLCIGDEQRDIEAAQKTGAASGAALWGYATRALLLACQPTLSFGHPAEIADILVGARTS